MRYDKGSQEWFCRLCDGAVEFAAAPDSDKAACIQCGQLWVFDFGREAWIIPAAEREASE